MDGNDDISKESLWDKLCCIIAKLLSRDYSYLYYLKDSLNSFSNYSISYNIRAFFIKYKLYL